MICLRRGPFFEGREITLISLMMMAMLLLHPYMTMQNVDASQGASNVESFFERGRVFEVFYKVLMLLDDIIHVMRMGSPFLCSLVPFFKMMCGLVLLLVYGPYISFLN